MSRSIYCPRCRKLTQYGPENPFRPFCSERCKTIDLGSWASEDYRIPLNQNNSDEQQNLMRGEFPEDEEEDFYKGKL